MGREVSAEKGSLLAYGQGGMGLKGLVASVFTSWNTGVSDEHPLKESTVPYFPFSQTVWLSHHLVCLAHSSYF